MERTATIGNHHFLINDQYQIFIDGHFAQISEVNESGIVLVSQLGQKYEVSGQDFYRLMAGGIDPDPKLVGELMAKDMMHRQKSDKPEPEEQPKQYKVKSERLIKG